MKKLILLMFYMILLIGTVSADIGDWNNALEYSVGENGNPDLKVSLDNWFGLGTNYGTAELKSHYSVDEIKQVGGGEDIVTMWYDFDFNELYKDGLGEVTFINIKNGKEVQRDYSFVYWGIEEYESPIYSCGKEINISGTFDICTQIGTETKTRGAWLHYNSTDIPLGKTRIGIKVEVRLNDYIDGIWIVGGQKINKHAVWVSSLETSLISWWALNETSGTTATDIVGGFNGFVNASPVWSAGKIANSFFGNSSQTITVSPFAANLSNSTGATFGGWVNSTDITFGDAGIFLQPPTGSAGFDLRASSSTFTCRHRDGEGTITIAATHPQESNTWYNVYCSKNSTSFSIYINGVLNNTIASAGNFVVAPNKPLYVGGDGAINFNNWKGHLDEMAIWNRSLSDAEFLTLYNDGNGCALKSCVSFAPTVTLISPANNTNFTTNTINFLGNAIDNAGLANRTLYLNESANSTSNKTGYYDFDGTDIVSVTDNTNIKFGTDIDFTISAWIKTTQAGEGHIVGQGRAGGHSDKGYYFIMEANDLFCAISDGAGLSVSARTDTAVSTGTWKHLVCVFDRDGNLQTYIDGGADGTPIDISGEGNINSTLDLVFGSRSKDLINNYTGDISEVRIYNGTLSSGEITSLFNQGREDELGSVALDRLVSYWDFGSNGADDVVDSNDGTNNGATPTIDLDVTRILTNGFYNWTIGACDSEGECSNATSGNFTIADFVTNSFTFNTSSFETESETFSVNITTNGTVPSDAELIYNGTTHSSATITNTAGDNYNITRTIDIPVVTGTKSWFFNLSVGGEELSTPIQNQLINLTNFTNCDVFPAFINITFKNETLSEENVTAQISSSWDFWLGAGSVFKTLAFTNTNENLNYTFCLLNINRTLTANVSLTYDNSISEQRDFSKEFTLTNTTTLQELFLLPTSEGIFVTFQVINLAEQVISGVSANVTKSGDLIATGTTDDAGLVQYFLDPDTTYAFSFFKAGFDVVTTTLKPTQTTFTITMGTANPTIINDTTRGISYTINPISNVLSNNTQTEFNLTFTSTFWGLDSFGFTLKNSTGDVFNITTATTETGGFLSRTLDTANNTDILMEVFWTIEGNQTNVTRSWIVIDTTDEGFSIKTFFDDLSTYLTSGLFGLTSFGLGIIIFLIIIMTTGVISVKLGITNAAGLSIIVFAMVLFFDVGLGIMPNPVGAVQNFPSIFVGVIFLGLLLKEAIIR